MTMSSPDRLVKYLRQMLILATELDSSMVRNALSVFGTSLDAREKQNVFDTICNDDLLLLFELLLDPSDSDCSMTESDDSISYFKGFRLKIIIYGKKSFWAAMLLTGRFRSDAFRSNFVANGINLRDISEATSINEFMNDVMWNRSDLEITFDCHFSLTSTLSETEFSMSNINVKEI